MAKTEEWPEFNEDFSMRTSDQSFMAKMGFADPDRKNPVHDYACQYLSTPEAHLATVASQLKEPYKTTEIELGKPAQDVRLVEYWRNGGQRLVGFIDLTLPFRPKGSRPNALILEVKIARETVSTILCQIGVYKQFCEEVRASGEHWCEAAFARWVVATAYPLDEADAFTLRQEGVSHVQLGPNFFKYVEQRKSSQCPKANSPQI